MDNKKIDYCDECLKEIDEFNKGIRSARVDYLGDKNNCVIHNPVKIYNENGITKWTDGQPYERSRSCLLYTSPSPRDRQKSRMPSSA